MFDVDIPGFGSLSIQYLVCDFNGTLAVDGHLLDGVKEELNNVARQVSIHVVTADTFGLARESLQGVNCKLVVLPPGDQAEAKQEVINELGADQTIAVGNGRNDRLMLKTAAVGIAVLMDEGASCQTIGHADILVPGILPALAFFREPRRLVAALRT